MPVDAIVEGFSSLLTGPTPVYVILGTLLGLAAGVVPGISGAVTLALLLPITLAMEPTEAIALLGAALGGTTFGGAITAILLNTPGTPNNAASCIDGYPLARQGRAGEAIGAAGAASAMGALVGLVVFAAAIPFMRNVILAFGAPELFMVAVFGLTIIASLSRGAMLAGLTAGAIGLMLSFVGQSPVAVGSRYSFGQLSLVSGIDLVPAIIGLFAVAEMMKLYVRKTSVSQTGTVEPGGARKGVLLVLRHPIIVLRSAMIGVGIGAVPGVGGVVAGFLAYSITRQRAEDDSKFGLGDIRGLIASESANDAVDGGTLMPTLSLGIPGHPSSAVLLAGLILHGTFPGRQLLTDDLHIVFTLVGALAISNVLTSIVGIMAAQAIARLTTIDVRILVPVVLVVTVFGSYGARNRSSDALVAVVFGLLGYVMMRFGFSRISLLIGFILGRLVERSLHSSLQLGDGSPMILLTRPISLGFFLLSVLAIAFIVRRSWSEYRTAHRQPEPAAPDRVDVN